MAYINMTRNKTRGHSSLVSLLGIQGEVKMFLSLTEPYWDPLV